MGYSKRSTPNATVIIFDDTQGQLHVDMVRFVVPVKVLEVRVIPSEVKVHSNANKLDKVG